MDTDPNNNNSELDQEDLHEAIDDVLEDVSVKEQHSESSTIFDDAQSITVATAPSVETQPSTVMARKLSEDTKKLLDSAEVFDDSRSTQSSAILSAPSSLGKTMGLWMKNAASLIERKQPPPLATTTTIPTATTSISADIVPPTMKIRVVDATDSICSYPNCVRTLNIAVTRFHCRKCNGWYCAFHAGHPSLAMKLDVRTGEIDWNGGVWSRVCERCFGEHFYPRHGHQQLHIVDHTALFMQYRDGCLRDFQIHRTRLLNRWERLQKYQANKLKEKGIPFRVYERQVVKWVDDGDVSNCKICRAAFTPINRKHHCRVCGEIICNDPDCSHFTMMESRGDDSKSDLSIRICADCDDVLFVSPQRMAQLSKAPDDCEAKFRELLQVKRQVIDILPRFKEQLIRFEAEIKSDLPSEEKVLSARHEAMAARDTLMLLYRHLDSLSKHFHAISQTFKDPEYGPTQQSIFYENIHRSIVSYLQNNMFTLQLLPKFDRRLLREKIERAKQLQAEQQQQQEQSRLKSSRSSSIKSEPDYADLSQKLSVLYEQQLQLEGFIAEAVRENRYADVRTLRASLEQIQAETKVTATTLRRKSSTTSSLILKK